MKIIIGGDLYFGKRLETKAINRPESLFSKDIFYEIKGADFSMINLESPLTNKNDRHKILKTGPNLKANPECVKTLKYLDIDLVTLANNHIFDFGQQGLNDTLNICKENKISTVGAGENLKQAKKIFYKKHKDITVAIINIAENEWGSASFVKGGANPLDLINNTRDIIEAKNKADFVFVIVHGGHEFYKYPSPRMKKLYRYFAEMGADLVVGHHTHCYSGFETYKKVPIYYSLGNFLFDSNTEFSGWYEGFLLSIEVVKGEVIKTKAIPYKQCKDGDIGVSLLTDFNFFNENIKRINKVISDDELLEKKYEKYIDKYQNMVLAFFSNDNLFDFWKMRGIIRKLNLSRKFLRNKQLKSILNYVRCESHRDLTFSVLTKYLNDNK
jgi:hypothetical protein